MNAAPRNDGRSSSGEPPVVWSVVGRTLRLLLALVLVTVLVILLLHGLQVL